MIEGFWWDHLSIVGLKYGYHPNASKTFVLVKSSSEHKARQMYAGTDVSIYVDGRHHLGATSVFLVY